MLILESLALPMASIFINDVDTDLGITASQLTITNHQLQGGPRQLWGTVG